MKHAAKFGALSAVCSGVVWNFEDRTEERASVACVCCCVKSCARPHRSHTKSTIRKETHCSWEEPLRCHEVVGLGKGECVEWLDLPLELPLQVVSKCRVLKFVKCFWK